MLQVIDYLHPKGALKVEVLWPRLDGETVSEQRARAEDVVAEYRADAYGQTSSDDASRHWVNYRAWSEKADDLNAMPASVTASDEGGSSYLQSQISYWTQRAAEALAAFEELVSVEAGETGGYAVITSLR